MELKTTRFAVVDGIATVTLCRPQRSNAWTGRMHTEYRWLMARADGDDAVRAIVVTGEGRAFCVGGDADALAGHVRKGGYDPGTPTELARPGYGVAPEFDASFAWHFGLRKPVIGALNGPAAGVGLALALFCDIRFAVPGAKLTTAHGKLNLPAEYGLSWLLPRMVGLPRANELLLSSRVFTTDEAHAMGMIHALHPADELLPATLGYVRRLVETVSPNSLRQTRWQIYRDLHRDVGAAVEASEALLGAMMKEPDYGEGVAAFRDKRPPRWGQ
ncbi:MAG: enoyl-CoA hydratase/isomerase family protein [Pseudomonadales bacterium]|nr:enoyl-CoA hydratase/isomerase family protein [Pseudomonadales bacterium]